MISESIKQIIIRCDSSLRIGNGHTIRCRTLAREFKKAGYKVCFICRNREGNIIDNLKKEFEVIELNYKKEFIDNISKENENISSYNLGCSSKEDADECIEKMVHLGIKNISWIIVDHYGISQIWEKRIIEGIKLRMGNLSDKTPKILVIDDLANRKHIANILLDQNYYGNQTSKRYEKLTPTNCIQLTGPKYALIAPEYNESRKNTYLRKNLKKILIFFGGVDPDNYTCKVLKQLSSKEFEDLSISVVLGEKAVHKELVKKYVRAREKTNLYVNLPCLNEIISSSDLCIGAGGTSTWERACLGLPTITYSIAKNQEKQAEYLSELGMSIYLTNENEKIRLPSIAKLKDMSKKGFDLCDGLGTKRLLNLINSIN